MEPNAPTLAEPDEASRFIPADSPAELPELFKAVVRNELGPLGEDRPGLRLTVFRTEQHPHGPRMRSVFGILLDHSGWEKTHLHRRAVLGCGAALGHELIRHGFMMLDRSSHPARVDDGGQPLGQRVFGWEQHPETGHWFTYVYRPLERDGATL